jgi:hypothetical protein
MNSSSFRTIIIFIIGISLALWMGVNIVINQVDTMLKIGGIGLLIISAFLGTRIWLLMIAFTALSIPLIRGFTTAELGQAIFLVFGILMLLMRRLPVRFNLGELEIWRIAVGLCIVQVYLRNPVGLGLFGSGSVGGKTYVLSGLAFMVSWIYGALLVPAKEVKWAMYLSLFCSFLGIPVAELRTRAGLAAIEATEVVTQQGMAAEGDATRVGFLGGIATSLSRWIASRVHPLKASFHPLWAPLILISLAAAAGSGFRNIIVIVGLTYLISLAYRGGIMSIFIAFVLGALGITFLSLFNLFIPLPTNAQRVLTTFPGTWEQRYKDDAKSSTEWRVEMWKEALFTDRWISNKWLGDGLGMSAAELARSKELSISGMNHNTAGGITTHQENAMISGDYHSGPVQTIRTVGYIGLLILLAAMIRIAVHAHRQIIRCRGTEWFPLALYFCTGAIASPIIFTFVVGDFGRAAVSVFLGTAFMRFLENNIPLPPWQKPRRERYMLQSYRRTSVVAQ